jgi:hypothetical protein
MAFIDDVAQVTVIRVSATNPTLGFGVPFIIGDSLTTFPDIVKSYSSLAEVLVDFTIDQPEYLAAKAAFSQSRIVPTIKIAQATDVGYLAAYNTAFIIDPAFYHVVCLSTDPADQLAIASVVETQRKIMGIASDQVGILTNTAGNLAETLSNLNYARTYGFYSETANTEFITSALSSKMLSAQGIFPNWSFKSLSGIHGDLLTNTERHNVTLNNFNYYTPLAGDDVTFDGRLVNGSFIDTQVGIDWMTSLVEINVVNVFKSSEIVPYDVNGFDLVRNAINAALKASSNRGVINPDYTITFPEISSVPLVDKTARILNGVVINATLTGGINKVVIEITATD